MSSESIVTGIARPGAEDRRSPFMVIPGPPSRSPAPPETPQLRAPAALMISFVAHVTLLALLALLSSQVGSFSPGAEFDSRWDSQEAGGVETSAAPTELTTVVSVATPATVEFAPAAFGVQATLPQAPVTPVVTTPAKDAKGGGSGAGKGSKAGADGEGAGQGGSGFFGLRETGDRIVFVVDCSRSMNHPHPGPARTRIGRVKLELLNSIGRLNENQQFFIVFFNHLAFPMPSDRLMEATESAKLKYLRWMAEARADGGTEPQAALLFALQLQPDLIYFLTDGEFNGHVVKEVAIANRRRIKIHTIGFGDNRGERLLKLIAEQSGGRYQFIPPDEVPEDATAPDPVAAP